MEGSRKIIGTIGTVGTATGTAVGAAVGATVGATVRTCRWIVSFWGGEEGEVEYIVGEEFEGFALIIEASSERKTCRVGLAEALMCHNGLSVTEAIELMSGILEVTSEELIEKNSLLARMRRAMLCLAQRRESSEEGSGEKVERLRERVEVLSREVEELSREVTKLSGELESLSGQ